MADLFMLRRKQRLCRSAAATAFLTLATALVAVAGTASRTALCGNVRQRYAYYVPEKGVSGGLPVIVLLHGAGDRGENMIAAWHDLAAEQRIVLLAPQLPRDTSYEAKAPGVFQCVVEDAAKFAEVDPAKVYLFGNSMGGYLAYDAAMFQSRYFAAAAVHAMRIADDYTWIVRRAQRKIPVAIYVGDRDQFFSEADVRRTRDLLRGSGFPVRYMKLIGHDHNYYAASSEINADAWRFFKEHPMPRVSQ